MSPFLAAGLAIAVYAALAVPMWLLLFAYGEDDARQEASA